MRKPLIIASFVVLGTLTYCSSSKKAGSTPKVVATYATDIAPIFETKCAPCHIPAKNGNKKAYDNYANIKADIDDILMRIQLDSTDKKFMPRKKPKLDDATIALLKQWKADGMPEAKP